MSHRALGEQWERHPDGTIKVQPGAMIYRQEARPTHEDVTQAESVGPHWTVHPRNYGYGYTPDKQQGVVWHGVVDNPDEQLDTTHRDRFNEGEVIVRPGTSIRVVGHDIGAGVRPTPGEPMHRMERVLPVKGKVIK